VSPLGVKLDIGTKLQHPEKVFPNADNPPINGPIYQSVKFAARDLQHVRNIFSGQEPGYFYSRVSNPTVRELEVMLANLQRREDALCVSTGMCAISTTLLALLKQDDHIIVFRESYKPTRIFANVILKKFGVDHTLLSITDLDKFEQTLKDRPTKLVIFESPTNPCLFIADIKKITAIARNYGVLTILDNTFSGFHNHGNTDVDIFVHSLTKFASGHSDSMGGAIIASAEIIKMIRFHTIHLGGILDPQSAYLTLRGMKTYIHRYRAQCETAQKVAEWLATHPKLKNVRYPGLRSHPQHELAKNQMLDFGSVISFDLVDSIKIDTFIDSLKIFHLAASIGSTESLVAPVTLFFSGDLTAHDESEAMISDQTVRLSIGLESAIDLINDIEQVLK
jgi:cystathionine beta-lyase/cystathionine gamma-synthase